MSVILVRTKRRRANYLWSVALNGRVGELHLIDVTILEKHSKHTLPVVGCVRVRVRVSVCRIR